MGVVCCMKWCLILEKSWLVEFLRCHRQDGKKCTFACGSYRHWHNSGCVTVCQNWRNDIRWGDCRTNAQTSVSANEWWTYWDATHDAADNRTSEMTSDTAGSALRLSVDSFQLPLSNDEAVWTWPGDVVLATSWHLEGRARIETCSSTYRRCRSDSRPPWTEWLRTSWVVCCFCRGTASENFCSCHKVRLLPCPLKPCCSHPLLSQPSSLCVNYNSRRWVCGRGLSPAAPLVGVCGSRSRRRSWCFASLRCEMQNAFALRVHHLTMTASSVCADGGGGCSRLRYSLDS